MAVDPRGVRDEAAVFEDARKNRKGRDAERDPHEERERMEWDARWRVARVERQRGAHAQEERNDDAEVADGDRGRRLMPEVLQIEIEAHREHEEDDADLAQEPERVERVRRKDVLIRLWPEVAEE